MPPSKFNMSSSADGGCCKCCFSFVFTAGLTALFMWVSLLTSNVPSLSITYLYLPALNQTLNSTSNQTLYLSLKLSNPNKDKGIYYDTINLNFSLPTTSSLPVGNSSVTKFYQGHKKKANKKVEVGFGNWTAVSRGVYENGSSSFRVDLETKVRFKLIFWKSKRHRLRVGADVKVNASGIKEGKKDVKLSAADHMLIGSCSRQLYVLFNFLVFSLLNPW